MKTSISITTMTLLIAMCVVLWQSARSVSSSEYEARRNHQLTMRETLGAAFLSLEGGGTPIFRAAHPDARKGLYKILEHRGVELYHPNCIEMLGFCGTTEDLPRLEAYLKECAAQSELSVSECAAVGGVPVAVAVMTRREVKGAQEKLEEMVRVTYWKKLDIQSFPILSARVPSASWELTARAVGATSCVSAEYAQKSLEKSLALEENEELRDFLNRRFADDALADAAKSFQHSLTQSMHPDRPQYLAIRSNGDLENPEPNPDFGEQARAIAAQLKAKKGALPQRETKGLSPQEIAKHTKEAQQAFEHFRTALKKEQYEKIVDSLLNDSLFMNEEILKRYRQQMVQEMLPKVAKLMDEEKLDDIKPADVAVTAEDGADGKRIIVVRWRLLGTADIGKRLAGNKRGDPETIDPDTNELLVLLKKKDGKWYWNPFNW